MRTARIAGMLLAFLLVRCGTPMLSVSAPIGESQTAIKREPTSAPVVAQLQPPVDVPNPQQEPEVPRPTLVRGLVRTLGTPRCGSQHIIIDEKTGQPLPGQEPYEVKELMRLGETAYMDYEFILGDPNAKWVEINGTCDIISRLQDSRRFIPLLLQRLTSPDALLPGDATREFTRQLIRESILGTLSEIGDEREAAILVRLLYQRDRSLQRNTVEALAWIGGPRELEALNAWLALQNPFDPRLRTIKKLRDQMQKRLEAKSAQRNF